MSARVAGKVALLTGAARGQEPRDVSNSVLVLASDEARYITDVALPVDAGVLIK